MQEWIDVREQVPTFGEMVFVSLFDSESTKQMDSPYTVIGFRMNTDSHHGDNYPWAWFFHNPNANEPEILKEVTAWKHIS